MYIFVFIFLFMCLLKQIGLVCLCLLFWLFFFLWNKLYDFYFVCVCKIIFHMIPSSWLKHGLFLLFWVLLWNEWCYNFLVFNILLLLAGANLDYVTYGLWRTKIVPHCSKSLKIIWNSGLNFDLKIQIQIWLENHS